MKALSLLVLFAVLTGLGLPSRAETFRFALIGDTPYNDAERRLLPNMLDAIGASGATLAVHVGDFKDGRSPCSDVLFADRLALFDAAPLPIVFVPGDNEWTDCQRTSNGAYDPLERLERLRTLFFAEPRSLGGTRILLERQSANRPEHVRWRFGPALFIGVNVPGGDNNWGPKKSAPSTEYLARMPQVLAWLRDGFAVARRDRLPAVIIAFQANPDFRLYTIGMANGGYRELLEFLRAETESFAGQVVVVHGDTHSQRIDHPLLEPGGKTPLRNFTRNENYGSPFMGWVAGEIDSDGTLRFASRPFVR